VSGGVAVELRGAPEHPYATGELCPKVNRLIERSYDPQRLLTPLRRVGPKGTGSFEACSWDEALALVAAGLNGSIAQHRPESILPYSFAGTQGALQMSSMDARLFNHLGASRLGRQLCGSTAGYGVAASMGLPLGIEPSDLRHSGHILLWGTNTKMTNRHLWPYLEEARAAGAIITAIDPIRTITAEAADDHVQLKPGTDVALALAMLHVIIGGGLHDAEYLVDHSVGFEELAAHVGTCSPQWAEPICGIDAARIESLARSWAGARAPSIRVLIGMEHRAEGASIFRAVSFLPTVVGAWRHRGGGLARSTAVYFDDALDFDALRRPDLLAGRTPRTINMSSLGAALCGEGPDGSVLDPPVTSLVVYNCNPAAITPDQNRVITGLERDDLFTVVLDSFMTDSARYADVVLPATTQIEHLDVVPAWGHLYLGLNRPAIAPVGESLPNTEIFRRIAAAMGLDEPALLDDDETLLAAVLGDGPDSIGRDDLERDTWVRLPLPDELVPYANGGFATGSGRFEFVSPMASLLGLDRLPVYRPAPESVAGNPELARRFPLQLITLKTHVKYLNTSYSLFDRHRPAGGEPTVEMTAVDAAARDLGDGDRARIFNDRGELTMRVRVSERVQPGLVAIPFGWDAGSLPGQRSANALTNATIGDAGGGSAFHDNLVQIEPASTTPPTTAPPVL